MIRPPRLWPDSAHHERRAVWTELFFDLIFVAAVEQVGVPFTHGYSLPGLLRYVVLFVLIWWAWLGQTIYSTRFDSDDGVQRILIVVQTFLVAVMAANAKQALDSSDSAGFGAAYAGMRLVLVFQYLRSLRLPKTRGLSVRYAIGFGIAAVVWLASAFLPAPARYWMWATAFLVDQATPWFALRQTFRLPPGATHLPERFGLFTIILLGEFVASVMRGIESQETWTVSAASTALMSMTIGFTVWLWYSDGAKGAAERHVRSARDRVLFHVWSYAHLPLLAGIGIAGIGFHHAISFPQGARFSGEESWILCSASALLMLSLIAIEATLPHAPGRSGLVKSARITLALSPLAAATFCPSLPPVFVVAALLCSCLAGAAMSLQRESPGLT